MAWYYGQNNQQKGPVSEEELKGLLASGALSMSSLVWTKGMPGWTAAKDLPNFQAKEVEWFYVQGGQQRGPVTEAALKTELLSGRLPGTTDVWTESMANWTAAIALPQFAAVIPKSAQKPSAPPPTPKRGGPPPVPSSSGQAPSSNSGAAQNSEIPIPTFDEMFGPQQPTPDSSKPGVAPPPSPRFPEEGGVGTKHTEKAISPLRLKVLLSILLLLLAWYGYRSFEGYFFSAYLKAKYFFLGDPHY